jgi:hypothetical protein
MHKTAVEIADQVLGAEAVARKRKERWISALTSGIIGTAAGLRAGTIGTLAELLSEPVGIGLGGLMSAELPGKLWKDPVQNADDPRWWRKDYSPVEHGLALGLGSGIGSAVGHGALAAMSNRNVFGRSVPANLLGTIATLSIPSALGYAGARQLMRMRDARRDAEAAGNA